MILRFLSLLLGLLIVGAINLLGVSVARAQSCVMTALPVIYKSANVGQHLFFPCADGRVVPILSCTHAVCDPQVFGGVVTGILTSSNQEAAYKAAVDKYLKWSCDAPPDATAAALCREQVDVLKPPVWRVKSNLPYLSRPGYRLANGALDQTKIMGRAPNLALCDLTKPTIAAPYGEVRAQWAGGPEGVVTLCSKGT